MFYSLVFTEDSSHLWSLLFLSVAALSILHGIHPWILNRWTGPIVLDNRKTSLCIDSSHAVLWKIRLAKIFCMHALPIDGNIAVM